MIEKLGCNPEAIAFFEIGFDMSKRGSTKGRIVIPIHDEQEQLLAYAARSPGEPPEGESKY